VKSFALSQRLGNLNSFSPALEGTIVSEQVRDSMELKKNVTSWVDDQNNNDDDDIEMEESITNVLTWFFTGFKQIRLFTIRYNKYNYNYFHYLSFLLIRNN
jgi:hypothetical protein